MGVGRLGNRAEVAEEVGGGGITGRRRGELDP